MSDDMRDGELPASLARSVTALRDEVPVRAGWRAELLARIEREGGEHRRVWAMTPPLAIAAGLTLLVAGAAVGRFSRLEPAAPVVATQSMATVPATIRFVYVAPGAGKVSVVGDFNQWNPEAMPLRRLGDGTWIVDVPLSPGRYAYAFVVDGKVEVDPAAPRASGEFGENSVLMVRGL